MPTWKFSGPPAPVRMMAGKATEPSSALPTRLNCCCRTVDLKRGEIPGQGMPTAPAPSSVGVLPPKDWQLFLQTHCAASLARACSPFNSCLAANLLLEDLLLWRHGVFQHGGLLIPLQSKMVFALFLQREREKVSASTYLPAFPSSCCQVLYQGHRVPLPNLQLPQQHRVPMAVWRQLEGAPCTPLWRGADCQCPSLHSLTFLRMISM